MDKTLSAEVLEKLKRLLARDEQFLPGAYRELENALYDHAAELIAAAERQQILMNALMKACGDDVETVNGYIESQTPAPETGAQGK